MRADVKMKRRWKACFISDALKGALVGFVEIDEAVWEVWFGAVEVAVVDVAEGPDRPRMRASRVGLMKCYRSVQFKRLTPHEGLCASPCCPRYTRKGLDSESLRKGSFFQNVRHGPIRYHCGSQYGKLALAVESQPNRSGYQCGKPLLTHDLRCVGRGLPHPAHTVDDRGKLDLTDSSVVTAVSASRP